MTLTGRLLICSFFLFFGTTCLADLRHLDSIKAFLAGLEQDRQIKSISEVFKADVLGQHPEYADYLNRLAGKDLEERLLQFKQEFKDPQKLASMKKAIDEAPAVLEECLNLLRENGVLPKIKPENVHFILGLNTAGGKQEELQGHSTVFVSLDLIASKSCVEEVRDRLKAMLLHELGHAAHQYFSGNSDEYEESPLLERLWSEGMATYFAEKLQPNLKRFAFSTPQLAEMKSNESYHIYIEPFFKHEREARGIFTAGKMRSGIPLKADHSESAGWWPLEKKWFGDDKSQPRDIGYLLGEIVIERVSKATPLTDLLRWNKTKASREAETVLKELAREFEEKTKKTYDSGRGFFDLARWGNLDGVRLALQSGANPNAVDNSLQSPLHYAAENGHKEVVELLLKSGAAIDAQDGEKTTPLIAAVLGGSKGAASTVELLLKYGAKANLADTSGNTALSYATQGGHTKIAQILLDHESKKASQPHSRNDKSNGCNFEDRSVAPAFDEIKKEVNTVVVSILGKS